MSPVVSDPPRAGPRSMETDLFVSRLSHLRGIRWRIGLCSLRCSSVDDLRRVTADSRRRYAVLRRRLLVDLHILKDGSSSPNLVMDNPLSESPDSMWGRFFRNAELEKMLDQDLSRLYPEHGSYFQTHGCQSMLRRILLLWCLRHPEHGYRQGMHELLAPLLYVLHADLQRLAEARELYEDHFTDKFDDALFQENDLAYNFDFRKSHDFTEDDTNFQEKTRTTVSLEELDPLVQTIVLLSDAYGAEGELGVVLSEKFMEHDVYCMFDALMSGAGGAVAMAEFFSPSSGVGAGIGLSPVIDASAALYHLLSIVDSSLYSHLIELGVEPQYFALRWLRVLFGREFSLDDLLIIWDEIFSYDNVKLGTAAEYESGPSTGVLNSRRGAFISAMAVSMMLNLRSSLLATETATSCLQRLLNFPDNIDLEKLTEKAKSLLSVALDVNTSSSYPASGSYDQKRSSVVRGHSLSFDSASPKTPVSSVPESYWEEKWRDLHKEEELKKDKGSGKQTSSLKKGWTEKLKSRLYRTESEPSPSQILEDGGDKQKSFIGRSLLQDLSKQFGKFIDDVGDNEPLDQKDPSQDKFVVRQRDPENMGGNVKTCSGQCTPRFEKSTICSEPGSPVSARESNSTENDLERSSSDSNESLDTSRRGCILEGQTSAFHPSSTCDSPEPVASSTSKDKKSHSGKFQWLFKLGRHAVGDGPSDKGNTEGVGKYRNEEDKAGTPEEVRYTKEADRDSTPEAVRYTNQADKGNNPKLLTIIKCTNGEEEDNAPKVVRCTSEADEGNAPEVVRYTNEADKDITPEAVRHPNEADKGNAPEVVSCTNETETEDDPEVVKHTNDESQRNTEAAQSTAEQNCSHPTLKGGVLEQKPLYSLRNIGQSMLENIQVIESVFQQDTHQTGFIDNTSKNALVEKGQATAMSALKELRKISNLLSEM